MNRFCKMFLFPFRTTARTTTCCWTPIPSFRRTATTSSRKTNRENKKHQLRENTLHSIKEKIEKKSKLPSINEKKERKDIEECDLNSTNWAWNRIGTNNLKNSQLKPLRRHLSIRLSPGIVLLKPLAWSETNPKAEIPDDINTLFFIFKYLLTFSFNWGMNIHCVIAENVYVQLWLVNFDWRPVLMRIFNEN